MRVKAYHYRFAIRLRILDQYASEGIHLVTEMVPCHSEGSITVSETVYVEAVYCIMWTVVLNLGESEGIK